MYPCRSRIHHLRYEGGQFWATNPINLLPLSPIPWESPSHWQAKSIASTKSIDSIVNTIQWRLFRWALFESALFLRPSSEISCLGYWSHLHPAVFVWNPVLHLARCSGRLGKNWAHSLFVTSFTKFLAVFDIPFARSTTLFNAALVTWEAVVFYVGWHCDIGLGPIRDRSFSFNCRYSWPFGLCSHGTGVKVKVPKCLNHHIRHVTVTWLSRFLI